MLVHGGRSIPQSLGILQDIDEAWPENQPLLTGDANQRALARFWIKFGEDKVIIGFEFNILSSSFSLKNIAERKNLFDLYAINSDFHEKFYFFPFIYRICFFFPSSSNFIHINLLGKY